MFTGIVEACVPVRSFERVGGGARLWVPLPRSWKPERGESLSVCGVCLSVVEREGEAVSFDLTDETLDRTWFGELDESRWVNLERAMRLSDRLGGHLVQGHVDGGGAITRIAQAEGGGALVTYEVDEGLERYLIDKGSVTLDGISLTVVRPRGREFDVAMIPETMAQTNLGRAKAGQRVNVEGDLIGKWVEHFVRTEPASTEPGLSPHTSAETT